jgi:hypothetical protein
MKQQDRIAKAYRGLTADQLAALAFHYMTGANDLEFKRVADAVPLKDYRCPDVAYQARLDGFTRFAACWAIEHWRLRCHKAEMLGAALAAIRRGEDFEKTDDLLLAHEQAESCLLALDAALLTICADNGIDPADVRKMAGAEPFKPMREGMTADGEMQTAMQSAFAQLLVV